MRRVEQIMGMPITVDIQNCENDAPFEAAFARLRQIDERFSTYKPDSEVSRFSAGEIAESYLSAELKKVIKACREAEDKTDGYFSAWAGGAFDPSGYVKGWAVAQAGEQIEKQGYTTYCVGAAGDILARSDSDYEWKIGIQDPRDPSKLLDLNLLAPYQNLSGAVGNRIAERQVFGVGLSISNGAVCTSGNYERGEHIINPKTKKPAKELLSVTITGPDIIWADVLATACFAMGRLKTQKFIKSQPAYQALLV